MGDVGDYWNDHRDYKREQKRKQQPFIDRWVEELHKLADVVEFSWQGPHLRVNGVLDFWPSTRMQRPVVGSDTEAAGAARKAIEQARKKAVAARAEGTEAEARPS